MTCVFLLPCRDEKEADKIASILLKEKLIVCAKKLPVSSSFLWKNKIKSSKEIMLIMDSIEGNFEKIKNKVKKLHSYETFVLTSIPINQVNKEAKDWIKEELEK